MLTSLRRRASALMANDRLRAKLAKGAAAAFVINVVGTGLSFLAQLALARTLGADGYGIFAYVTAWVALLSVLATLGFRRTLVRFVSVYRDDRNFGLLRGVIRYAERRIALAGALAVIVGLSALWFLKDRLAAELYWTFAVGMLAIPITALAETRGWTLRGMGHVIAALLPLSIIRPLLLLIFVGASVFLSSVIVSPASAMGVTLLGTLLCLVAISIILMRDLKAAGNANEIADARDDWRKSALALFVLAGLQSLFDKTGILMLGWFADTTDAGIFAVAYRIANLTQFPLMAINVVFAPTIAKLHAKGDNAALQQAVTTTARWVAAAAVAISLPFLLFAEFFLGLFGEEFVAGANCLRIILAGQLLQAAAGSVNNLIIMTGHERQAVILLAITTVGQLLLAALLIPRFGLEGAAVARFVAITSWTIAAALIARQRLDIVPSVFGRRVAT